MSKFFIMKRLFFALLFLVLLFSLSVFAQKPKKKPTAAKPKPVKVVVDEKAEFDKAIAITDATERIKALQDFIQK
ncbi:MAG: hypothetical protein AAB336_05880, partial [Acidobacteriota bacterium]